MAAALATGGLGAPAAGEAKSHLACPLFFQSSAAALLAEPAPSRAEEAVTLRGLFWLRENAARIAPATQHLPELVRFAESFAASVQAKLSLKSGAPAYDSHAPLVVQALEEIRARVASGGITYEFLYGLSFRMGALFEMSGRLEAGRTILRADREPPGALRPETYATHARFMEMIAEVRSDRPSLWRRWADGLRRFPQAAHLPFARPLSRREINWCVVNRVFPIGWIPTPGTYDNLPFDEIGFPFHDLQHREQFEAPPYWENQIRPRHVSGVARAVLLGIERDRSRLTAAWYERLQFIQYLVFFEDVDFVYRASNGEGLADFSAEGFAHGFRYVANRQMQRASPLAATTDRPDLREDFLSLMAPGEDPAASWREVRESYLARLDEALRTYPAAAR